ncbi:MAG: CDC48 family AAA ATPase [Thermoproteota archaeon]|jgi:transitional endoplasmic reticulum ATPase|nr:CDC48 family AAA ATPase [Thermoproteota archaeon]
MKTSSQEKKELILRVAEAKQRDVGKGRVRIDSSLLEKLNLGELPVVEIEGKSKTVALALPALPEDEGLQIIRMDGLLRKNANVSLGEKVIVRKADYSIAELVKLAPQDNTIVIDQSSLIYIKNKLMNRPLIEGDLIQVPGLEYNLIFKVIATKPSGVVIIDNTTNLVLLEKPFSELARYKVSYEDIGGLKRVIEKVRELIELPLRYPELFKRLGIDPPKGILLYGPPGSGKTLLAKAVANESAAYFISVNGPEIMNKYYGESEARLREIFEEARQHAPSIIFIDEIDAIAPRREEVHGEVEKRVVAQLLALMDGLESRDNVIVIGATNVPNMLDPALRRPGRFDREIEFPVPDKNGRLEILQIHTRNMPLAQDVNLEYLAEVTHGFVGADLAALVREAAMKAIRRYLPDLNLTKKLPPELIEKVEVKMEDFLAALKEITPSALREVYFEKPNVKLSDIGGLEDVKRELYDALILPVKDNRVYKDFGIEPVRGILLVGPPGVGKTMLAKAIANESGINFIAVNGPSIYSKWVGESERAIREIFRKAKTASPAIIFFDEIEAIASVKGAYSSEVYNLVLSQFLTELDGFDSKDMVFVLGATNRPDLLDPAVLRTGRFDKIILILPPNEAERLEIFKIYTKRMKISEDVDLQQLAKITNWYTGADIKSICREAALFAIREKDDKVRMKHFLEAVKKVRPSTNEAMVNYYLDWYNRSRQLFQSKPSALTFL